MPGVYTYGGRKRALEVYLSEKDLKGLNVGKEISLQVRGKVKSVEAPPEYTKEELKMRKKEGAPVDTLGSVIMTVSSLEIDGANEFSDLAEED